MTSDVKDAGPPGRDAEDGGRVVAKLAAGRMAGKQAGDLEKDVDREFPDAPPSARQGCPYTPPSEKPLTVKCFKCPKKANRAEFEKQLKLQEEELNNLDVKTFMERRKKYEDQKIGGEKVRDEGPQIKMRDTYKENAKNIAMDEIRKGRGKYWDIAVSGGHLRQGEPISVEERDRIAEIAVKIEMDQLNATHLLDLVAGGDSQKFTESLMDATVNKSIGSQWARKGGGDEKRVATLDRIAEKLAGKEGAKMEVCLSVCPEGEK